MDLKNNWLVIINKIYIYIMFFMSATKQYLNNMSGLTLGPSPLAWADECLNDNTWKVFNLVCRFYGILFTVGFLFLIVVCGILLNFRSDFGIFSEPTIHSLLLLFTLTLYGSLQRYMTKNIIAIEHIVE